MIRTVPTFLGWACALLMSTTVLAQLQLPTGIEDEAVCAGLDRPTGLAFLPDGRALVVEQITARLRVVVGASSSIVGVVPGVVSNDIEQGLLAVAVDPAWPAQPFVYVLASVASPPAVQVLRFAVSGDLADPLSQNLVLGPPYVVLDDAPDQDPKHNGGALRFGTDGMLYVSLGDDDAPCDAPDPEILSGKILRLDVAAVHGDGGSGPPPKALLAAPGNPFGGPVSQLVWATGLRNPFRFAVDPVDGSLILGDVGEGSWEEVDLVDGPGLDFGWPSFEGSQPWSSCPGAPGTFTPPIHAYPQVNGASVIPLGGRYRNPPGAPLALGPGYEGDVLIGDFITGDVVRLRESQGSWGLAPPAPGQPDPQRWATGLGLVTDALVGPDGALWYTRLVPGSLRRLRPSTGASLSLQKWSGDLQAGNALRPIFEPLVARCTDGAGQPVAGVPVAFSLLSGAGQLDPQPVVTAADGTAATGLVLGASTSTNPVLVEARTPGAAPVVFSVIWRGLVADHDPLTARLTLTLRHSQPGVPLSIMLQPPGGPTYPTALGDILVDILSPPPGAAWFDGLGLFGPLEPAVVTGPTSPSWSITIQPLPVALAGQLYLAQGFALEALLFPAPEAVLISNPVTLAF